MIQNNELFLMVILLLPCRYWAWFDIFGFAGNLLFLQLLPGFLFLVVSLSNNLWLWFESMLLKLGLEL